MPELDHPALVRAATDARPALPLQGLTLLAVEDSRFASEALRLLCHHSGARLRRAETMQAAMRHLAVYRPDVVIVDLGLPDGDGADLIRALVRWRQTDCVILGTSGDPAGRAGALAAGAAGFLDKPPESLHAFQAAILRHLPGHALPDATASSGRVTPDPLALHDDLAHAAALLSGGTDAATQRYVAGFLRSVAGSAQDAALARAADQSCAPAGLTRLSALLDARLAASPGAFARLRD